MGVSGDPPILFRSVHCGTKLERVAPLKVTVVGLTVEVTAKGVITTSAFVTFVLSTWDPTLRTPRETGRFMGTTCALERGSAAGVKMPGVQIIIPGFPNVKMGICWGWKEAAIQAGLLKEKAAV